MRALHEQTQLEFANYRSFSTIEHANNETIIKRQQEMLNTMFQELRATKTLLEIPRLREQLPKYDFKGINFEKFTEIFGKIYSDISLRYNKYAQPSHLKDQNHQHTSIFDKSLESIKNLSDSTPINDAQNQIPRVSLLSKTPRKDDKFTVARLRVTNTESSQPEISYVTIDSIGKDKTKTNNESDPALPQKLSSSFFSP